MRCDQKTATGKTVSDMVYSLSRAGRESLITSYPDLRHIRRRNKSLQRSARANAPDV